MRNFDRFYPAIYKFLQDNQYYSLNAKSNFTNSLAFQELTKIPGMAEYGVNCLFQYVKLGGYDFKQQIEDGRYIYYAFGLIFYEHLYELFPIVTYPNERTLNLVFKGNENG